MVDSVSMEVRGLRELETAALELGARTGAQALRRGLVRASRIVVDDMKRRVPVDEGGLQRSIGSRSRIGSGRSRTVAQVRIGPIRRVNGRTPNRQAIAVEFGTRYQPAQPFILPALERNWPRVVESFRRFAWAEISRVRAGPPSSAGPQSASR